jgi:5'-3' exonuclease
MGIPSYFQSIIKKNPNKCFPKRNRVNIDYLCLDFNCCIHGCVRKVEKKYWSSPPEILEQKIIYEVVKYVNYILDFVKPNKGLCIFVDGLVPMAKMRQQRDRRFKKNIETQEIKQLYINNNETYEHIPFDTNAITPGTVFMSKLSKKIHTHFKKYCNDRTLHFVMNDDKQKGEGEHKCFHWIEDNLSNNKTNICVYGLDADLIMLSLKHLDNHKNHKLFLLREKVHFGKVVIDKLTNMEELLYFDVSSFLNFVTSYHKISIPEYVCLCSLMGNDFIPHHPGLEISSDGIEYLIDIYNTVTSKYKVKIINSNFTINLLCLRYISENIHKNEYKLLLDKENKIIRKREKISNYTFRSKLEKDKFIYDHKCLFETPSFNIRNNTCWYHDYYEQLFNEKDIFYIVEQYILSLNWANLYYNRQDVSYTYYYSYDYAPLFSHIYHYLMKDSNQKKIEQYVNQLNKDKYSSLLNTTIQRILVLPPESHNLIHEYSSKELETLSYMYGKPKKYQGMFREMGWMKTPILPPMLFEDVIEFCSRTRETTLDK